MDKTQKEVRKMDKQYYKIVIETSLPDLYLQRVLLEYKEGLKGGSCEYGTWELFEWKN